DQGGAWQKSTTRNDSLGDKRFVNGRFTAAWAPTDRLAVRFSLNAWQDRSDTQTVQLAAIPFPAAVAATVAALLTRRPAANNDRAADWDPTKRLRSDDDFYQGALRVEYQLGPDVKLTSVSSYSGYHNGRGVSLAGTDINNFFVKQDGDSHSAAQE